MRSALLAAACLVAVGCSGGNDDATDSVDELVAHIHI